MDSQSTAQSLISMVIGLAFYVYFAYSLMVIADKTKTPNSWMAWIPVLNAFLMVKAAGKSYWWILLFFIPLVNIVIAVIIWMEIAKRRNKPSWLGILMLVPLVNFIIPGYLAFSE